MARSLSRIVVEVKPDRPDLLDFEGAFGSDKTASASIPWPAVVVSGVKAGSSHDALHPGAPARSH
jgi:hypothetical protein